MSEDDLSAARTTFSAPPEIMEKAKAKARAAGKKFSNYIAELVARDVEQQEPQAGSPTIMVDLASALCGKMVGHDMSIITEKLDQARTLEAILRDIVSGGRMMEYMPVVLKSDLHTAAAKKAVQAMTAKIEAHGAKKITTSATIEGGQSPHVLQSLATQPVEKKSTLQKPS